MANYIIKPTEFFEGIPIAWQIQPMEGYQGLPKHSRAKIRRTIKNKFGAMLFNSLEDAQKAMGA